MEIALAVNGDQARKAAWEGPTRKQALRMAEYRSDLLAKSAVALAAGDDERAFDLDCDAFDIEADLIRYGFDLNGKPASRSARTVGAR